MLMIWSKNVMNMGLGLFYQMSKLGAELWKFIVN